MIQVGSGTETRDGVLEHSGKSALPESGKDQ